MRAPPSDARRALALLAAAGLCALGSNALAPASRRVSWTGAEAALPPGPASPPALAGEAPGAARPDAPGTAHPEAPASAAPDAPATARPEGPTTAHPAAPATAHPAAPATAPRFLPDPDASTREIGSEDAWAAFQQKVPFLDARRSGDFAQGHVAGATSAPVWEADLEARLTRFEAEVNPGPRSPLVLYCSGGDCPDSRLLARRLEALGYRNLLIYRDGFPDWVAKGRPAHPGQR